MAILYAMWFIDYNQGYILFVFLNKNDDKTLDLNIDRIQNWIKN